MHALKRKRAQIAGFIADNERKARDWRVALVHVDATLKLFDAELDPEDIRPKRPHRKSQYYSGPDLARLCLDELRKANGTPLTAIALADKRVETLETDLKAVGRDIAEVKGKLSQMPTTFQLMSWFVGVAFALTLLVFTIAKTVK